MSASELSEKKIQNEQKKLHLDTILVQEIGQFGRFQLRCLLLAVVVVLFAGWASAEYVFSTARISTRCRIQECDSEVPEFSPDWMVNAIPGSGSSFDNCQRYGNTTVLASAPAAGPGVCPAGLFNSSVLLPCEEYVYENTNTVVYDLGLACDEWRRTLIGSLRTVGTLVNLPFTGHLSDRWGRRAVLVLTTLNSALIGITRYWAGTYAGFVVSQVLESTLGSGAYTSTYILLTEVVGPKYRVAAGAAMHNAFSISQITLALIAWGVPYWRKLTLTIYIPQFIIIGYFWLMTESVRWYMSKGRYEEAEALLQKIARINRKQLSPESLTALRQTAEDEKKRKVIEDSRGESEPWLIVQVYRHKKILLRCLVCPVWWVTSTFINYGMSINSVNMSGNRYVNYAAVSAVEIPGTWTAVYLMDKVGRKPVLIGAFWVCAACQFAYVFMPSGMYAVSLSVYLIGKYSIAMEFSTLYMYTAELFPTKHRHTLFAFSSMLGRIGHIVAPLTPAFGAATFYAFPSVLFGSFALVSGALALLTPETRGSKLPDSMDDADNIGRNKQSA